MAASLTSQRETIAERAPAFLSPLTMPDVPVSDTSPRPVLHADNTMRSVLERSRVLISNPVRQPSSMYRFSAQGALAEGQCGLGNDDNK